jgi:hypothetical protein
MFPCGLMVREMCTVWIVMSVVGSADHKNGIEACGSSRYRGNGAIR